MNIKEFYEKIEGSYEDIIGRLRSEDLVKRFLLKFVDEPSFQALVGAVETEDIEETISAAHKLKGVTANLGFIKLCSMLTELLRQLREEKRQSVDKELMEQIADNYNLTITLIREI